MVSTIPTFAKTPFKDIDKFLCSIWHFTAFQVLYLKLCSTVPVQSTDTLNARNRHGPSIICDTIPFYDKRCLHT